MKNKSFMILSLFSLCTTLTVSYSPDLIALRSFRGSSDPSHSLSSWDSDDPCTGKWLGVSCRNQRVTRLVLQNLNLSGSLQPLAKLDQLRVLSLKKNSFHTTLPNFTSWRNMKLLYLSHNRFSGDLPVGISTLRKLRRLDLSYNDLTGRLTSELARLSNLLTLRLENNQLTGNLQIFAYRLETSLEDFNVSNNQLRGAIPRTLSGFPSSSFTENHDLCGSPLPKKCLLPKPVSEFPLPSNTGKDEKKAVGEIAGIVIAVADLCALGFIVWIILYCCCWTKVKKNKWKKRQEEARAMAYCNLDFYRKKRTRDEKEEGMVFFEGRKRFKLEDLLKASAEMLGKGSVGSTYKATFDDGNVVVVKRLRERASGSGKKSVEHQMEVLGGLKHSNLVNLIAYYKSKDEMLLVYDYFNNGSLHSLLHDLGNISQWNESAKELLKDSVKCSMHKFDRGLWFFVRKHSQWSESAKGFFEGIGRKLNILLVHKFNHGLSSLLACRTSCEAFTSTTHVASFMLCSSFQEFVFYSSFIHRCKDDPEGNRGPGRMPLDWTTRLKLALDSARGLSFVHHSCKSKLFHGNLTTSNILIDHAGNARISDMSLSQFVTLPSSLAMNTAAAPYRAPEQTRGGKSPSQRSDVYSFGIVLLEILTGKSPLEGNVYLPKWVQCIMKEKWTAEVFDLELLRYKEMESEMVSLLQIALKCLCEIPLQRPKMSHVVKMIMDIRGANDDAGTCSSIMNENSSDSSPSISGETGTTNTTYY